MQQEHLFNCISICVEPDRESKAVGSAKDGEQNSQEFGSQMASILWT